MENVKALFLPAVQSPCFRTIEELTEDACIIDSDLCLDV